MSAAKEHVEKLIAENAVVMFSKAWCPFCAKALTALEEAGAKFKLLELEDASKTPMVADVAAYQDYLKEKVGTRSVPKVFAGGKFIGGGDDVVALHQKGELASICANAVPPGRADDPNSKKGKLKREIEETIGSNKVVVISKSWCPFCRKVGLALGKHGVMDMKVVEADYRSDEQDYMNTIQEITGKRSVPQVWIGSKWVGGCDDTLALDEKAELRKRLSDIGALDPEPDLPGSAYDYDLFVLGGGSGGAAAALEAAQQEGVRVACADFVKASPAGTTWGVGGTCVNVGCIPKKLMHIAATMGENTHDLAAFGWTQKSGGNVELKHDWDALCKGIRSYIKDTLNQGLLDGFSANNVAYHNAYATLKDRHTILLEGADGVQKTVTSKNILLAAGGRPNDGGYPGAKEYCITSDDLFWLKEAPGKTLVVGAAYIALECAGFLTGLGYDTTVMVRSMLLRGFDRECVDKIDNYMVKGGTKFIRGTVPTRFEKGTTKKVRAFWKGPDGAEVSEEYDTVLLAVGRKGEAEKLGLANAGIKFSPKDGKVFAPCEQTNIPNIFCVGDLVADRPELTPVAKVAGKKVVGRLFKGDLVAMDYTKIATTVFTPLEYGMVGLTEEQAREKHGEELEVITKEAKPLEWAVVPHRAPDAFFKILVDKKTGRLVGFHILGPNAGEITQAMALAIKMGVTKDQLDDVVGIHPTLAETMTMMSGKKIAGVICES
jgi:thioredoxin/glutathione reductase (selenoprotein)